MHHYQKSPVMQVMAPDTPSETHNLARILESDGVDIFGSRLDYTARNRLLDVVLGHTSGNSGFHWSSAFEQLDWIGSGWTALKEQIKHKRRFVTPRRKGKGRDIWRYLDTTNPHFVEQPDERQLFYRARLHEDGSEHRAFAGDELGAPPAGRCKAGRANASGIRVLYTADSEETAIAEIRPHIGAILTVGEHRAKRRLKIFDLAQPPNMARLDPFSERFSEELQSGRLISQLNEEFAAPVAPFTPERDYAPTQVVAEFLAEASYDGVKYRSAARPDGRNWVFFDPELFELVSQRSFKVKEISVGTEDYDPEWMQNMPRGLVRE